MTRLAAFAILLTAGCTSVAPSRVQTNQAELDMHLAFVRESATFEHGACLASLDYHLSDVWIQFRHNGVMADSDGVFLFLAGDEYLWVAGLYAGRAKTGPRLIVAEPSETEKAQEIKLSEHEYSAILNAAHLSIGTASSNTSVRSHNPCEYLAMRAPGGLVIRATRQAFHTDSDGLENDGGFRQVRELMVHALESKTHGDRK